MPYVLLLHAANPLAYNIASAVDGSEFEPVYFLPRDRRKLFRKSRYFRIKGYARRGFTEEGYVHELCEFINGLGAPERVFTFLTSEDAIDFWCANETVLEKYLRIPTRDIDLFRNKRRFFQALEGRSIAMPKTAAYSDRGAISYPYLVKPATKKAADRFVQTLRAKCRIVGDDAERELMDSYGFDDLICQEVIDFELGDEFSWWGYRSPTGELVSLTAQHRAKFPNRSGRITRIAVVENPRLQAIGRRIVEELDFRGIADIQFIYDRASDRYVVTDPNPRLWCSHEILLMNDINLIRLMLEDHHGLASADAREAHLRGLGRTDYVEWFSSIFNVKHFNPFRLRCTEFFGLREDTLPARLWLTGYLGLKMIYYGLTRSGA